MLAQRQSGGADPCIEPGGDPGGDHGARWMQAMRRGDFTAAWAVNDQVLAARDPATRDHPALPYHERWLWDGQPLEGRHVLVRCYHGLGDTLQFCRYLAPLRRMAGQVTLEVQPPLAGLLRTLPGVDHLHPFDPASPLPAGERTVEIMELSHALRQRPDPAPYLAVQPQAGAKGRVGLCWTSGGWDRERDVPVGALRPLLHVPGLVPISLQRGPASAEAGELGAIDPLDGSMDVSDLARLVAGLDTVVTVDTMVAHLAGALGVPCFVLLKRRPDWRWGAARDWYGSVRPMRQTQAGMWDDVVKRTADALRATLAGIVCS